jgi:hypothetical protein
MTARIYKPARTAMQSGKGRTEGWVLEFLPQSAPEVEPLMGWTSSADTQRQVKLTFDSREDAVAYAVRNGIPHRVEEPKEPTRKAVSYSDNFKYNRVGQWTH